MAKAGSRSAGMPRAPNTSTLPVGLETPWLPCFATFTPTPATTKAAAVERFTVPCPSPPGAAEIHGLQAFSVHGDHMLAQHIHETQERGNALTPDPQGCEGRGQKLGAYFPPGEGLQQLRSLVAADRLT